MEWAEHHWVAWWSPEEGMGDWSTELAQWLAGWLSLSSLQPGRGRGATHQRCWQESSQSTASFPAASLHRGQAAVPAPQAALFYSGLERLSPVVPPHQVTSAQGQLSQPFPATKSHFFFFSFSRLRERGGGKIGKDLQGSNSTMPVGGGLAPSLTRAGGEVPRAWAAG